MILFKIISVLFFLNLYNSFTFTNYKLNNKPLVNMYYDYCDYCDYYIEKNLRIHYFDNSVDSINIKKEFGYYDIDDNIFSEHLSQLTSIEKVNYYLKRKKMIKYHLKPKMIPYLIYCQNNFNNEYLSDKYKQFIETILINNNKEWYNVQKILMVEERYERDKKI